MEMDAFPALSALLQQAAASARQPSVVSASRDLFLSTVEHDIGPEGRQLGLFDDTGRAIQERERADALVDAGLGIMNLASYVLRSAALDSDLWRDAAAALTDGGRLLETCEGFLRARTDRAPRGLALDVALAYQASGQLPRSYVAAQRFLREASRRRTRPVGSLQRFHSDVLRAIGHFLSRDLQAMEQQIAVGVVQARDELASRMNESMRAGKATLWHVARFVSWYDLAIGLLRFSEFLSSGQTEAAQEGQRLVASAADLARQIHSPVTLWIVSQLQVAMRQAEYFSLWRQLGDRPSIPATYISLLAQDTTRPVYELWPSQVRALSVLGQPTVHDTDADPAAGVFRSVVALPTGAGKSLIAETAIVEQLSARPGSHCAYVVPTRSLAGQASHDLAAHTQQLGVRVVSLEDVAGASVRNSDVFVCTPEKLNSLLGRIDGGTATEEFNPSALRLLVVDEAQLIGDQGKRGLLLEMLIVRLRRLCPFASVVLLSGVASNVAVLGRWLAGDQAAGEESSVITDWSPSGLLYGVLRPDNTLEYENGASLRVPALAGSGSRAVRLVVQNCLRRRLKTLVFVNSRRRAGSIAEKIASLRPPPQRPQSAQLEAAIEAVRDGFRGMGLGPERRTNEAVPAREELPLIRCLRQRVAFHHAALPTQARRAIEDAARQGEIDVVVATTTLAEGLNLPMNCVVLADLDFRDGHTGQRAPISRMLCRNIVGRAGRPYEDTRGEAIMVAPLGGPRVDPEGRRVSTVEWAKSYWVRRSSQLEPVRSSLRALCAEVRLATAGRPTGELASAFQAQLLAALQEGGVDRRHASSFLAQTLLAYEPDGGELMRELLDHTRAQLRYIHRAVEAESVPAFRRTGLSVAACLEMQRRIGANLASDRQFYRIHQVGRRWHGGSATGDARGTELLNVAFVPSRPRAVRDPVGLLSDWISGDSVAEISGRHLRDGGGVDRVLRCSYLLEREIRPNAAWALSGFRVLLDDWRERKDNSVEYTSTVALMPRYVDYGVNHPVAVYMLDIGAFRRRDDALTAAYAFDQTEQLTYDTVPDLHFTLDWMKRVEYRALAEYTDPENAERIQRRLREYGRALPGERADAAEQGYV